MTTIFFCDMTWGFWRRVTHLFRLCADTLDFIVSLYSATTPRRAHTQLMMSARAHNNTWAALSILGARCTKDKYVFTLYIIYACKCADFIPFRLLTCAATHTARSGVANIVQSLHNFSKIDARRDVCVCVCDYGKGV